MSQRDVVAEIRASRAAASPEVRERVRLLAVAAAPPRRGVTWRRVLVVLVPVAAGITAAVIVTRPSHHGQRAVELGRVHAAAPAQTVLPEKVAGTFAPATHGGSGAGAALSNTPVAPSPTRAQRYGAFLDLRVHTASGVSDGVKRALRIATSLGGYPVAVDVSTRAHAATGDLVLKVPRTHVRQAIARLSELGTIVGEQVEVQDLQAGINTTDRTIARIQRQLAALRAQPAQGDAVKRQIAALTARVEQLQRRRADTSRSARFATVQLTLSTPAPKARRHHGHGPLHGLGIAFRWLGIGLVYALALGIPAAAGLLLWLALRTLRRRRVEALLSRP